MKFLKTIFSGVLIATAVSTLVAMDGPKPAIDCLEINNKEALVNALKHHGYIEAGFTVDNVWDSIPECVKDIWRLDPASKKSILDAHARINRSTTYETPGAPARLDFVKSRDEQLKAALDRKFASTELDTEPILKPSRGKRLQEWVGNNKWKSAGIGIITLAAIDALQAYARVDKATWQDSDLKGKLELMRRKMLSVRMASGACRFLKSKCG